MSNRRPSENSDTTSLLPFLAVLLCTMGTLLVVLVALGQRTAEAPPQRATAVQTAQVEAPPLDVSQAISPETISPEEQARLKRELAEIAAYRKEIDGLREEGKRRLVNERERLSHAEEHARRLEEELAKLTIAAEQLKQTEQNQTVDQKQAEEELARLQKLIVETEAMIENLRKDAGGKKSYAIVPYKGPNGTYRKPVYIECTAKGVTIQPEGIELTPDDFLAPRWPGNPLASVLRATREYLNQKAAREGAPEPPDPYPLLLIRPSGNDVYGLCYHAIKSWDADYGYEFIEEDMKLAFPEGADPELARVQHHALMVSRERLLRLVQSAPSRFPDVQIVRGVPTRVTGGRPVGGYGAESGAYAQTGEGTAGGSSGFGDGMTHSTGITSQDGPEIGNLGGNEPGGVPGTASSEGFAQGTEAGEEGGSAAGEAGETGAPSSAGSSRYAQQSGNAGASSTNAPSDPLNGANQPSQNAGGNAATAGGAMSATQVIADTKGANWATGRPDLRSMAIRRPIPVVVRENKMILKATSNNKRSVDSQSLEISLDQSVHDISERFATAVKERIEDWGLAGSGMYWKPVLELNVEPNAEMTATRIAHLLRDSGVEVQLPQTARGTETNAGGTVR
jgi:hypothetical protein